MEDKFLKSNAAASYLGISRSSLTNWVKQGILPSRVTPGGHYRFTREELDEFARKRGLVTAENAAQAIRILVVDDNSDFREFVHDALEDFSGCELREAEDGMKGAMTVGSWKPDLVILDIRMPNMDGAELLKLIRSDRELHDTNVIVASAHLSDCLKKELENDRPNLILEKPVRLAKLIAAVQKLVDLDLE